MSEWICDDREDVFALMEEIDAMSDEEFEKYIAELKKEVSN